MRKRENNYFDDYQATNEYTLHVADLQVSWYSTYVATTFQGILFHNNVHARVYI